MDAEELERRVEEVVRSNPTLRFAHLSDEKDKLLRSLIALKELGEPMTLSAAARRIGLSENTARSWRRRDSTFAVVVALVSVPKVEPAPLTTHHEGERDGSHLRLTENVATWKRAVRYEKRRHRNGHWADPRRAERMLERAERELRLFEGTG